MKTILTSYLISFILVLPFLGKAQQVTFSGTVLDGKTGKALKYASIFESNSKIGTISDKNGLFRLVLSEGVLNIQISENGFKDFSKQLVLKSDTSFMVKLEPELDSKNRIKNNVAIHADANTSKKDSVNRFNRKTRH